MRGTYRSLTHPLVDRRARSLDGGATGTVTAVDVHEATDTVLGYVVRLDEPFTDPLGQLHETVTGYRVRWVVLPRPGEACELGLAGCTSVNLTETVDPYAREVDDVNVPVTACPSCLQERADAV